MKRLLCLLLAVMMFTLTACTVTQTEPPTGDAPAEQDPVTQPEDKEPTAATDNLLLNENAKRNESVLPRGIDKEHTFVKELADQTITLYYCTLNNAFSYTKGKDTVTESAWLKALQAEYGITIHAIRKSESSSLAAQRIAMLSGKQLDLLSFTPAQLPFAGGMTADATAMLEGYDTTDFLNQSVLTYGDAGKRFFTPVGVARNLWYTKQAATSPLTLSESELWDWSAFQNFVTERTKTADTRITTYGYEAQDFTDFLAALGTPMVTYNQAFTSNMAKARSHILALQKLNSTPGYYYNGKSRENAPSLIEGTLAMRYGQTPFVTTAEIYPAIGWAPLPTAARHSGKGVVSACAPVLALPKDGPQNKAALCAALLWTARMADANHDMLRFTYGLSFADWTKYYNATNTQLQIVTATGTDNADALRRLAAGATFEESEYAALVASVESWCVNADARLNNE